MGPPGALWGPMGPTLRCGGARSAVYACPPAARGSDLGCVCVGGGAEVEPRGLRLSRVPPGPPAPPAPHRVASVDATERGDVPRFSGDIKAKISADIKGGWDVADVKKST